MLGAGDDDGEDLKLLEEIIPTFIEMVEEYHLTENHWINYKPLDPKCSLCQKLKKAREYRDARPRDRKDSI